MSFIREIEADLDWREAELASLRLMMVNSSISEREKLVLFRAAWSLLYAHYEGFCKFALSVYYDQVLVLGIKCGQLPDPLRNHALSKTVKLMRNKPIVEAIDDILNFEVICLNSDPVFPEVDTESNLWPNVLEGLLEAAALNVDEIDENRYKLKTLVSRRNKIAHGERDIIIDFSYYEGYEIAFREVAYNLAIAIENKVDELSVA
jgi:hypothetical protein